METAVLKSRSKNDLKLLLDLARKIGIDVRLLTNEETEETGLFNAIKSSSGGKIINTKKYLDNLRNQG